MRSYLILLIILFNLAAIPARCEDVVLGTVASVDRKSGEVVLHLTEWSESKDNQNEDGDIPERITVQFAPGRLPGYISVGETVRVWGKYPQDNTKMFQVQSIGKGYFQRPKSDPTGVRRRLGRSRGGGKNKRRNKRPPRRHR